jgi:hypothetical protein
VCTLSSCKKAVQCQHCKRYSHQCVWLLHPQAADNRSGEKHDATALRIEQLRMTLEQYLGEDVFVPTYKYVQLDNCWLTASKMLHPLLNCIQ